MNHRRLIVIGFLLVLSLGLVVAVGERPVVVQLFPRAAETRLVMSISATKPKFMNENPVFLATFRNAGGEDVILNLGMMLANGKVLLPDAIRLVVIYSAGKCKELHFADRRYPGVAGRIDDYAVPLRVGSSYTLRLSLNNFWCPETKEFRLKLKPGRYRVRSEFAGRGAQFVNGDMEGIKLMNFWQGTLQSDVTTFRIGERGQSSRRPD